LEGGRPASSETPESETPETTYLCQQLSVALHKGNAVSFQNTFTEVRLFTLFRASMFSVLYCAICKAIQMQAVRGCL